MEIVWNGHSCFTLKGNAATVVTDPYGDDVGLKLPKLKANVITVSREHSAHNNVGAVEGEAQVFDFPGEYESCGILMTAIETKTVDGDPTLILHMELDGIKICHLGAVGEKLSEEIVEMIGDVDVLMVPIGGVNSVDHKIAHEIVEQIDPRVVLPMHYKIEGVKDEIAGLEPFMKEVGGHGEPEEKLVINGRSSLPEETTEFVTFVPHLG